MLLDLIETRGDKGKWFAAAKDSGIFDIAVGYAASHTIDTRHRYAFSVALQAATPDPRLVVKRFELRRLERDISARQMPILRSYLSADCVVSRRRARPSVFRKHARRTLGCQRVGKTLAFYGVKAG